MGFKGGGLCRHVLLEFHLMDLHSIQLVPICSCSALVGHKAPGLCSVLPRCSDCLPHSGFAAPLPRFLLGIHRCCIFPPEAGELPQPFFLSCCLTESYFFRVSWGEPVKSLLLGHEA